MMTRRLAFLVIAAVIAAATVLGARSWLTAQLAMRAPPEPTVIAQPSQMVLVAKADLPAGHFVRVEDLRWQPWPENGVSDSYVVAGKGKIEDYAGAVVRSGITMGEPIADGRVVRPGDRGFMAAVLTPGNRAVTVPVTPSSGIAGFVFPGDRVDVILTLTVPQEHKDDAPHRASETVLGDIRVLAVDQRADDQKKEVTVAKTATLEVTPKQAEVIAVIGELGKISLSLRSLAQQGDQPGAPPASHTWDSEATKLLAGPASVPPPSVRKVSVVRGVESKEFEFAGVAR